LLRVCWGIWARQCAVMQIKITDHQENCHDRANGSVYFHARPPSKTSVSCSVPVHGRDTCTDFTRRRQPEIPDIDQKVDGGYRALKHAIRDAWRFHNIDWADYDWTNPVDRLALSSFTMMVLKQIGYQYPLLDPEADRPALKQLIEEGRSVVHQNTRSRIRHANGAANNDDGDLADALGGLAVEDHAMDI